MRAPPCVREHHAGGRNASFSLTLAFPQDTVANLTAFSLDLSEFKQQNYSLQQICQAFMLILATP